MNENEQVNQNVGTEQVNQNAVPPQENNNTATMPTNTQGQTATTQQPGWWQRNWKKVVAIGTAVLAAAGGTVGVAHHVGKKRQANYTQGQQEDYSLNPNIE